MKSSCYPEWYRDWLFSVLAISPGGEIAPELLESLHTLRRTLLPAAGERQHALSAVPVMDRDLARAYACFYMSVNLPKLWFVLDRCPGLAREMFFQRRLRVLEAGCGPGTFLWSLLFYLQAHPELEGGVREIIGIDRGAQALDIARRLGDALPGIRPSRRCWERRDWRPGLDAECELLLLGNVLNENPDFEQNIQTLTGSTAETVILIEPGVHEVFQRLRGVRDRFIEQGWQVRFPCTETAAPCPIGADNWCHFHVNRFSLPFIQRMAGKLGRLNPRHHFCAFVFSRPGPPSPAEVGEKEPDWRVLSTLRKANRSGIRYLCNGRRVVEVVLSRKMRSTQNRDFLTALPGDRLRVKPVSAGRRLEQNGRLKQDDQVTIVSSLTADKPKINGPQ